MYICIVFMFSFSIKYVLKKKTFVLKNPVPVVNCLFLIKYFSASIVVVITAQLTPQIVASIFPVQFLQICVMRLMRF